MNSKLYSFLILFFLSLFSAGFLIFIWTTLPENADFGALVWIYAEMTLAFIMTIFVLVAYYFLTSLYKLPRVSPLWYILFPVIINFVIGYWSEVGPMLYWSQYFGLNTKASVISETVEVNENYLHQQTDASYTYEINIQNAGIKDYDNLQLHLSLAFLDDEDLSSNYPLLGSTYTRVSLKKGDNIIRGKISIDNFDLACRNFGFNKKIKLIYVFNGPFFKKQSMNTNPAIDQKLKEIYDVIKVTPPNPNNNDNPSYVCPEWTSKFWR